MASVDEGPSSAFFLFRVKLVRWWLELCRDITGIATVAGLVKYLKTSQYFLSIAL